MPKLIHAALAFAITFVGVAGLYLLLGAEFVGLVQVVPVLLLSLPAGQVADQFTRKRIVFASQFAIAILSIGLTLVSYFHGSLLAPTSARIAATIFALPPIRMVHCGTAARSVAR